MWWKHLLSVCLGLNPSKHYCPANAVFWCLHFCTACCRNSSPMGKKCHLAQKYLHQRWPRTKPELVHRPCMNYSPYKMTRTRKWEVLRWTIDLMKNVFLDFQSLPSPLLDLLFTLFVLSLWPWTHRVAFQVLRTLRWPGHHSTIWSRNNMVWTHHVICHYVAFLIFGTSLPGASWS